MEKFKFYKKSLFAVALLSLLISCQDQLDINESPNNPPLTSATPEVLFPSGLLSSAGRIGGDMAILGGIWAQYWTQSNASNQYKTIDSYNLQRGDFNGGYSELFSGALNDYQLTLSQAEQKQDWRYFLMATVMKAYTYQVLVDLYDQVPYSEAFKGQSVLQPKFDAGFSVYQGLLAEINNALSKDYQSVPLSAEQKKTDFIFGGDMGQWERFANTLKLKMYLRMVNNKAADAQAGIQKLYTDGALFLTVSAGISSFTDTPDGSNPLYEYNIRRLNTTTNLRASKTLVSWLIANDDPRNIAYFGTSVPIFMHQGDFTATAAQQPTYANATTPIIKATDPVLFISAAESYFMQAEARERYFAGAGAQALYIAGVQAAFAQTGTALPAALLTPANTGTYAYPAGTFATKLSAIITQKWASLPGSHALEGFFEQNRTGYPAVSTVYSTDPAYVPGQFVYSKNGVTGGKLPERLVFPDVERSRNSNTPTEVPLTTKVWWAL